jgi:thimet oligopeptidase
MQYKTFVEPDFSWVNWSPADIKKKAEEVLAFQKEQYKAIKSVPKKERTFENTFYPFEVAGTYWSDRMHAVEILKNASENKAIRKAAQEAEVWLAGEFAELIRDKELYAALKEYKIGSEPLRDYEKLMVKDALRGFKRMGLDLPEATQREILKLTRELTQLKTTFAENIAEYQDHIEVTKKDLEGFPERYIASLEKTKKGYKVTLSYPDIDPFMKHASDEKLREALAKKSSRKGGPENLRIIERIIAIRQRKAKLLGYTTHADVVLEERMAKTPATVFAFLENLNKQLQAGAKRDIKLLADRKKQEKGAKAVLKTWDTAYYANKLLKETYNLDTEALRDYFPLEHVLTTMFELFGGLFNARFEESPQTKRWHKDVRMFAVYRGKTRIGYIGMDCFPRPGKFSHMAAFPIVDGREQTFRSTTYVMPVSTMIGNFSKPVGNQEPRLSLGEVETLFHEFGHLLHNTLTRAALPSQSGFDVTWDFVELPSQLSEAWLREPVFLKKVSKHYQTGAPLPKAIIDTIIDSELFLRSMSELRQNTVAKYDMILHTETKPVKKINQLYAKMFKQTTGMDLPKESLFPAGFGHIAGGYDAGYYSYKWAEVYACDVFSRFKKEGLFSKKVGNAYLTEIIERGSSRDEMESLKTFLGRKPSNTAFLKSIGLKK